MTALEQRDRFRSRGSLVLYLVAIVFALGVLIAVIAPGPPGLRALVAVGLGVNAAYLAWVARALAAGLPWARPVAIIVLWFLVISGVVETLVALSQNRSNIPIGTLLALFALAAPAGPIVLPQDGAERSRALTAIAIGALIVALPIVVGLAARGG